MKPFFRFFALSSLCAASAAALSPGSDAVAPPVTPVAAAPAEPAATRDPGGDAERRLQTLTRETTNGRHELDQLGKDATAAHTRLVTRGRAYVRMAKAGLLPVGGGFSALVDHAVRLERLRNAIAQDIALERDLSARRVALARRLTDAETRRGALEAEVQALGAARTALLSEQDRADAFARAFSSSVGSSHTAVYGAGMGPSDPTALASGFGALKGRLPFPLIGRSEIRTAHRSGSDGPGVEMLAPAGSPVRAVHAGRVAFADAYAAYGRTVIIDHGGGYYTVSANLGSIDAEVGDDIATGARIGTVGDADGGARLYFEIRSGTATVPASEWFGI